MGLNFDETKKKLNLDDTLEKVKEVVRETVDQIDDAIDKGRETLTEKFDKDRSPEPTPGSESTAEPKPDYDI